MTERAARLEEAAAEIDALFRHQRHAYVARAPQRDISLPQLYLLANLQERGSLTISELADLVGVTPPSTSAIIDRMEEHGLVERRRDTADRRVVHVEITERGRTVVAEMAGIKQEQMRSLLATLSDGELADVVRGLRALRAALERAIG